jgi:2-hydroxy-6-oxonona-2,4-dienedioate hydrolase
MVSAMTQISEQTVATANGPVRVRDGGKPGAPAAVFLHGGTPGVTPYCSGAHIWGDALDRFGRDRRVIVLDLPGSGGTPLPSAAPNFETMTRAVLDTLDQMALPEFDLVGHDLGGFMGLALAIEVPARLRSLSVVASPMSPPIGDRLDDTVLTAPPHPLWSRESQYWAFDRLSYAHAHIDDTLLNACMTAAAGAPHRQAVAAMAEQGGRSFAPSVGKARYRLWEVCRNEGIKVPTQIVWASHDPLTSQEAGFVLFDVIAKKQSAAHFHLVNRSGSFPFREQPAAFHHIVSAFQDGAMAERAGRAA